MKRTFTAVSTVCAILLVVASASAAAIPAGAQVPVRITENLSSANARVGQTFHGSLEAPIMANGRVIYPKGSQVTGKVVAVHASGRLSDPGVLELKLVSVSNGRSSSALNTQVFRIKGESHTKSNVTKIGGTAAAGSILGAIFGGGKGALIGAGAGAAAGTTVAAATGKKEAKVESEAVLPFVTAGGATVAVAQPAPAGRQVQTDYRDDDQPAYRRPDRDDNDDDRDNDRYRRDYRDDDRRYAQAFSDDDRRIIRSCYSEDYSNLPPGLAKRGGNLPPGLERQLQRNGTLPPGLQKRVQPLPQSCERRLPPVPSGWFRVVLSGRVMLLDGGYRIMDIFALRGD
jgi:outer membrane lipoprotein SlyB